MPVTLEDEEARFVLHCLLEVSGPGITLSRTQPLVAKIMAQLPKQPANSPNVRPIRPEGGKR